MPNRVKTFVWRVCHNILPALTNLQQRKTVVPSQCVQCGAFGESVQHALRDCWIAKQVWKRCSFQISFPSCPSVSMLEWIEHMFQVLQLNERALVAMIMWLLWCRRNFLVHEGWGSEELLQKAHDLANDYLQVISHSDETCYQATDEPVRWNSPTGECVKVNVDAAELHNAHAAGFGLIARDSAGFVLG